MIAPQGYSSYQWYFYSTPVGGANNFYFHPVSQGNYSVVVTEANGCEASYSVAFVYLNASEINSDYFSVEIIPNPSKGALTFLSKGMRELTGIEIYSFTGQLIYRSETDFTRDKQSEIKLPDISKGLYFVKISSTHYCRTQKLIIE